jgi:hypothetical protein
VIFLSGLGSEVVIFFKLVHISFVISPS